MRRLIQVVLIGLLVGPIYSQKILIPMDETQTYHLKAYGVVFWSLEREINIEWLLNYRGGSFLLDSYPEIIRELRLRDVRFESAAPGAELTIYAQIESNNMDIVLLEKAPKIAVYSPPGKQPWDDAVTLALTYADQDTRFSSVLCAHCGLAVSSVAGVPIQYQGRLYGVLELVNRSTGAGYSTEELNALAYIGRQLAERLSTTLS